MSRNLGRPAGPEASAAAAIADAAISMEVSAPAASTDAAVSKVTSAQLRSLTLLSAWKPQLWLQSLAALWSTEALRTR